MTTLAEHGRQLARSDWQAAGQSLERLRLTAGALAPMPDRAAYLALELELGRALSAVEQSELVHAYRSELHHLNAEHELAARACSRGATWTPNVPGGRR